MTDMSKVTFGSWVVGTLIGHRPWKQRYRQYDSVMERWYRNVPFYIGQKVLCVRDDEWNHKTKGIIYTIRGFGASTRGDGWFLSMKESGVSSWWENFSPITAEGCAIYTNGWSKSQRLRTAWMSWNHFVIKVLDRVYD